MAKDRTTAALSLPACRQAKWHVTLVKDPVCYDHHVNVYNTLSGAVEAIEPSGRAITLYVCGITPYDTSHLGHAFTYTVADVFVRHLESQGVDRALRPERHGHR